MSHFTVWVQPPRFEQAPANAVDGGSTLFEFDLHTSGKLRVGIEWRNLKRSLAMVGFFANTIR
jgi:hypothetical protein